MTACEDCKSTKTSEVSLSRHLWSLYIKFSNLEKVGRSLYQIRSAVHTWNTWNMYIYNTYMDIFIFSWDIFGITVAFGQLSSFI